MYMFYGTYTMDESVDWDQSFESTQFIPSFSIIF